ncbi:MAG TPA: HAD-IA family hydrolase [Ktedonobacteraceae bacterium]|jgi:HAD superfamily hydrolase (TIGR01509 family)|nr:HAD-IA family hydrolase [Ktedonobacteraceae bacterium]
MRTRPVLLIDDGGVMNDNRLRGEQWPALVGEFFAPRLGGTLVAWAGANRTITAHIFEPENWRQRALQAASDYSAFERAYWLDWLGGMCQLVGISCPPKEECIDLARQAEAYVIPRVRTACPGASETIRHLHTQGYTLHTASGESSIHLQGYLEGMGVRDCFGQLYGSDLLDTLKERPEYYTRLFANAQLDPTDALVIDDSPRALAWARELGATTVLISAEYKSMDGMYCIGSLAELPELLQWIEA